MSTKHNFTPGPYKVEGPASIAGSDSESYMVTDSRGMCVGHVIFNEPGGDNRFTMSLSAHQSAAMKTDEWLTPPSILFKLGDFDLDPCAPVVRPWKTAKEHYTKLDNGLAYMWQGRVWLNPPFGREAIHWLRKMARHRNGIALIPARTETAMFYECVWGAADAVLFVKSRPHFHYVTGAAAPFNSGAPICLVAYGQANVDALRNSGLGIVLTIPR